jgi:MFS family permease
MGLYLPVLPALSPTLEPLIAARFVQGLAGAGAAGIVIAQAAGRDLYTGTRQVCYYGRLSRAPRPRRHRRSGAGSRVVAGLAAGTRVVAHRRSDSSGRVASLDRSGAGA